MSQMDEIRINKEHPTTYLSKIKMDKQQIL